MLEQRLAKWLGWGRRSGQTLVCALLVVAMAGFMGCAKKQVPVSGTAAAVPGGGGIQQGAGSGMTEEQLGEQALMDKLGLHSEAERQAFMKQAQTFKNDDIHFDYDSYVLNAEAKGILDQKAVFVRKYPAVQVSIEGHCDERGTSEYNLALGERRAKSAWQYLVNSGIDGKILDAVSYGEERPLASGRDEASFARNRRAHFDLIY